MCVDFRPEPRLTLGKESQPRRKQLSAHSPMHFTPSALQGPNLQGSGCRQPLSPTPPPAWSSAGAFILNFQNRLPLPWVRVYMHDGLTLEHVVQPHQETLKMHARSLKLGECLDSQNTTGNDLEVKTMSPPDSRVQMRCLGTRVPFPAYAGELMFPFFWNTATCDTRSWGLCSEGRWPSLLRPWASTGPSGGKAADTGPAGLGTQQEGPTHPQACPQKPPTVQVKRPRKVQDDRC